MKSFRTLALGAVLTVGLAATASAQNPAPAPAPAPAPRQMGAPGGPRMSMTDRALQGITLTDAQKARKDSIDKVYQPQLDSARAEMRAARESGGDVQSAMGKMRETQAKVTDAVKSILTDEQKAQFDKNVEEMRARMQQMGGGRPPAA